VRQLARDGASGLYRLRLRQRQADHHFAQRRRLAGRAEERLAFQSGEGEHVRRLIAAAVEAIEVAYCRLVRQHHLYLDRRRHVLRVEDATGDAAKLRGGNCAAGAASQLDVDGTHDRSLRETG
jgi:hypothetical protein